MEHQINEKLDEGMGPALLSAEEMRKILINPLSEARYVAAVRKDKKHPDISCKICGRTYTQSNVTHHKKSKHHIFMESLNKKLMSVLTNTSI